MEIFLCAIIVCINIENNNYAPHFRHLKFLLWLIEMCCATVKGVMDIMDANGQFDGIQNRNNNSIIIRIIWIKGY